MYTYDSVASLSTILWDHGGNETNVNQELFLDEEVDGGI
jgi:hypothetical protein